MSKVFNYLFEFGFIALLVRVLVMGTGIGEAIGLLGMVAGIAYKHYLTREQTTVSEELQKKIDDMATTMQSLQIDKVMRKAKLDEQKEIKQPKRFF